MELVGIVLLRLPLVGETNAAGASVTRSLRGCRGGNPLLFRKRVDPRRRTVATSMGGLQKKTKKPTNKQTKKPVT